MKPNLGTADRVIRILLGAALIVLAWMGVIGVWGYLGIVLLATGVVKYCPAYGLLGLSTYPREPHRQA